LDLLNIAANTTGTYMVETNIGQLNMRERTMKPIRNSFLMTLVIAGLALSQPKLFLDKNKIDLGPIYNGDKKDGKIVLKNIGNDTLRILYVGASCGCTAVKNPREFLLPGQSDDIDFEFTPFGTLGKVEKSINITTNDPTSQYVNVRITAEIKELLHSIGGSNALYIIENAAMKKPVTKRIAMKNVSGLPIIIRGDSVSSTSIAVKMDKKNLRPNDTLNVDVTVAPEKAGLSSETLYILTDRKNIPSVELKITILGTQ
jgi:hypothetical protein